MSLKNKAILGVKWTGLSSLILNSLMLVQVSVLARFLTKEEFGVIAIVMIVVRFVQMFVDLGVGPAIIHKQSLSEEELSSLYWLNIFIAFFLYFVIFFVSPYIASFYSNPQINFYIKLVALSLIFQSFGKQFYTLFEKELQFDVVAKIQIFSSFITTTLSIIMAVYGFKIYSVIIPSILNVFLNSLLLAFKGMREIYMPKFVFKIKKILFYVKFGITLTIGGLLNYINSRSDEILIGKLLGSKDLGLYYVTKNIIQKPQFVINPIITRVTFPLMAKIQDDVEKLKNVYMKTVNAIATVNFLIYTLIIVFADLIVKFVLGPKWIDSVRIMQILSVYFMIRSTGSVGSLILSRGKPKYSMYWNLALFFLIPITIYISSFYGIIGVSIGWVCLMSFLMFPLWLFVVKPLCGAGFVEYFKQIFIPLMFSVFMVAFAFLLKKVMLLREIYFILFYLPVVFVCFILYNWIFNRGFMMFLIDFVKPFFKKEQNNVEADVG